MYLQDDWRNTNHSYNYQGNVFVYHLSLNMKCPILKPYNYIFLWGTERWWELLGKDTNLLHVWKKFPDTFLGIKKKKISTDSVSKQMAITKLQEDLETNPQKDLWSSPRRSVIHFPCCHDVKQTWQMILHDEIWLPNHTAP